MIGLALGWLARHRTMLLLGVALVAGWLAAMAVYTAGQRSARAQCQADRERAIAEAVQQALAIERSATVITRGSAERTAEKEKLLHEQARIHADQIRQIMAAVPECRVPRRVGRLLDRTSGAVPEPPRVAEPPAPDPDGPALDSLVRIADELEVVQRNYAICRTNADRLTEAERWYSELRERFNRRE